MLTDRCYVLLHEVRLRGLVAFVDDEYVRALLDAGLVAHARGSLRITPPGREAHAAWARLDPGSDAELTARRVYDRFGDLNRELLRICHDWQIRPGDVTNDHQDARYDWSVIDRLRGLDDRARAAVRRLARDVQRFDEYPSRLRDAVDRVEDGDHAWLTSPRIDSYHTVWMQLHEDLLLALGLDREPEPG